MRESFGTGWLERIRGGLKSSTFANTSWSALGAIVNGFVGALSSAILARYLGIQDFGTLVLMISLLSLMTELGDVGIGSAVVRFGTPALERNDSQGFRLVGSVVFRMKLLLGCVVLTLALAFLNPIVSAVFGHVDDRVTSYFYLSVAAAAIAILGSMAPPILQTYRQFRHLALVIGSRYVSKLIILAVCIILVVEWSVELGLWLEIVSAICFLLVGYWLSPVKDLSLRLHSKEVQREVLHFNKWISLHHIILIVGGRADVFLLGGLVGSTALGLYGAALKISGVIQVATSSYHSALLPEFSAASSVAMIDKQRRSSAFVGVVLIAVIGAVALVATPMAVFVFGPEFEASGMLLQIMAVGLAFNVLSHPFMAGLFAMNESIAYPIVSSVSMAVFTICNILLVPRFGAVGAAVAFSASGCATFLVAFGYSKWLKWKHPVTPKT